MDLLKRFQQEAQARTYRRLDQSYKVNIYIGYNESGQMSLVIAEQGKIVPVKSTKEIQVLLSPRNDGKAALSFNLLNMASKQIFLELCRDLIQACETAGPMKAIPAAIERWKLWLSMFSKKSNRLLEVNAMKGLIGELSLLSDFFIPKYGETAAVHSWMGPILGHKDFEVEDTWYEVKSCSENALKIEISSLLQLDADAPGHLVVSRLEKTNKAYDGAVCLNSAVEETEALLSDPEVLELFRFKLRNSGYQYDPEYENYYFRRAGRSFYRVDDHFPALRRSIVEPVICEAKYSILLLGLEKFKEGQDDC